MQKKSYKICEFCKERVKNGKYNHYLENLDCKIKYQKKLELDKKLLKSLNKSAKEYNNLKQSILSREMNFGENNPMYGKKPWNTDESRKEEIIEKLGASQRGRITTKRTRKKMANAKMGIFGEKANAYGPHNISEKGRRSMEAGRLKARLQNGPVSKYEIELMGYIKTIHSELRTQEPIGCYVVDGYIPSKNLVIEADGNFWHALTHNLVEIKDSYPVQRRNFANDVRKEYYLLEHNYNLLRILESDFYEHKQKGDVKRWLRRLLS